MELYYLQNGFVVNVDKMTYYNSWDPIIPVREVARLNKHEHKRKRPSRHRFVDEGANMIIGVAKHEEQIQAEEE